MARITAARRLLAGIAGVMVALCGTGCTGSGPLGGQAAAAPAFVAGTRPAGSYAFILPRWLKSRRAWRSALTGKHHDHPSIDIAAPAGTPYVAISRGVIRYTSPGNACGLGVVLFGRDGARYTYCHSSRRLVRDGAAVAAGRRLGLTGGTHLHFQIVDGGRLRCPQKLLWALYAGTRPPPDARTVRSLPTTGCVTR